MKVSTVYTSLKYYSILNQWFTVFNFDQSLKSRPDRNFKVKIFLKTDSEYAVYRLDGCATWCITANFLAQLSRQFLLSFCQIHLHKSRGEHFLWNRKWDLGWSWGWLTVLKINLGWLRGQDFYVFMGNFCNISIIIFSFWIFFDFFRAQNT